jgi:glycosyltransferase involved in cell wall biosynthesis
MTDPRPLVTVVTPAFNEEALLDKNLRLLATHLDGLSDRFRWEMVVVNDGSKDRTGAIADAFAAERPEHVRVVHHPVNLNLGQGIRTGIAHARGEYLVVLDVDLSYAPDHIERLVDTLVATRADIVVASPYMPGGKCTGVPFLRLFLSKRANRFLAFFCHHVDLHTITGMVRGYRTAFVRKVSLKSNDIEINTEIIYKSMLLRGRVLEIPAHLDWSVFQSQGIRRMSSFRVAKGILTYILSGFYFRPFIFFVMPGLTSLVIALYLMGWIGLHTADAFAAAKPGPYFDDQLSNAIGLVWQQRPHAFFVCGLALMTALQLISLGFMSFQQKRYFEDLFFLGSDARNGAGGPERGA